MKRSSIAWSCTAALALAGALGSPPVQAQSADSAFPVRPIRLIVPYPPGGSTDPAARLIASEIGPRLGQSVVVENRAGAAGAIGTEAAARAAPDGYTLLFHTSVISTDPTLKKNAPYDVKRDLAPVTLAVTGPYLLVVNPALPVRTVGELIAYAKANPGKLSFGSAGQGSSGHLIGELFKKAAGIEMVHVPYKGGGPSIVGLVGNEVQLVFDTFSGSRALAESGKLRAIAVTSASRSGLMPDVPTVSESGLKDFSAVYWLGVFAPAKTPAAVIDKIHGSIKQALESPSVRARTLEQGNVPQALGPAEFARILDADIQRYRAIIESARISLD
jgi:tripartite-type tricarboxylate transporter receptor subunit TctC